MDFDIFCLIVGVLADVEWVEWEAEPEGQDIASWERVVVPSNDCTQVTPTKTKTDNTGGHCPASSAVSVYGG